MGQGRRRIAVRPRAGLGRHRASLLGVACLGMFKLDAHGLTTEESYTKDFDSIIGQRVLTDARPGRPVQPADGGRQRRQGRRGRRRRSAGVDGLDRRPAPAVKDGVAYVQATIAGDALSQAAFDTVDGGAGRGARRPRRRRTGRRLLGDLLDVENASNRDNLVIIPIVLVVVMLILMVLLRAVLSPLLLIGTVVLSFGAALGLSSLLFHYVFGFAGADASFPLFVFVFLVALGIDYNIFLMTRVREETQTRGTRAGFAGRARGHRRRDHLGRAGAGRDVPGARHLPLVASPRSASRWRSASSSTR